MGKMWIRLAGITGIVVVLLVAIPPFTSGSFPDTAASASQFASYVANNRTTLIITAYTAAAADFFLVFFLGVLYVALRRMGASAILLVASLAAIILAAAMDTFPGALEAGLAFRFTGAQHVDATVARMIFDASSMAFGMLDFTLAAFLITTGAMMARASHFPTWLAGVAYGAAVLQLIGTFTVFGTSGFFSLEGFGATLLGTVPFSIFVVITSILMIFRAAAMNRATTAAARPGPTAAMSA